MPTKSYAIDICSSRFSNIADEVTIQHKINLHKSLFMVGWISKIERVKCGKGDRNEI